MNAAELQRLAGGALRERSDAVQSRSANAQAWHREMERAQVESWLRHGFTPPRSEGHAAPQEAPPATVAGAATAAPLVPPQRADDAAASSFAGRASDGEGASEESRGTFGTESAAPAPAEQRTLRQGDSAAGTGRMSGTRAPVPATAALAAIVEQCIAVAWNDPLTRAPVLLAQTSTPSASHDAAATPSPLGSETVTMLPQSSFAVFTRESASQPAGERLTAGARTAAAQPGLQMAERGEPVRIHYQWTADGLGLWLGVDAARACDVAALTREIRLMLARQGLRLASVVCNGERVFGGGDAPDDRQRLSISESPAEEATWRSTR